MAHLVYACRFEIQDELSVVAEEYRKWFVDRYSKLDFDPLRTSQAGDLPDQHSLSSTVYSNDGGIVCCINWFFPDDKDKGLRWINDIRLGQFGDLCSIEHKILIDSLKYNVAPVRLDLGSPRVVRDLCFRNPINVNKMEFRATPYILRETGELSGFLQLLFSKHRSLPIVFLSPYARGEANLIDADQLALNLAGVAAVVEVPEAEVIWDFTDLLDRQLSCFNGAARIYWPGFSQDDDPRVHRLFLASWIEKVEPDFARRKIEKTVFSVAAFRFIPDQRISEVVLTVEKEKRQENLRQLRRQKMRNSGRMRLSHLKRNLILQKKNYIICELRMRTSRPIRSFCLLTQYHLEKMMTLTVNRCPSHLFLMQYTKQPSKLATLISLRMPTLEVHSSVL